MFVPGYRKFYILLARSRTGSYLVSMTEVASTLNTSHTNLASSTNITSNAAFLLPPTAEGGISETGFEKGVELKEMEIKEVEVKDEQEKVVRELIVSQSR